MTWRAAIAGVCALALGALCGACGSSLGTSTSAGASTVALAKQPVTSASSTTAITAAQPPSTVTVPLTTSTGTSTTPPSTSTATTTLPQPGCGLPTVAIGDKNFTEQFILGYMYALALQGQGFDASLTQNIGPTSVTLGAMSAGTLDIYPEYLNVLNNYIAGYAVPFASAADAWSTAATWGYLHGLTLLQMTPFSDTDGIAVLTSYAYSNNALTLAGLQKVQGTLTLGAPLEFQAGGLKAIENAYYFTPASVETINVGEQYAALGSGSVQAVWVRSTDGQLLNLAYYLLRDFRHTLGFGQVVPVIANRMLDTLTPTAATALQNTLNRVDGLLTTAVIRHLNAEVDLSLMSPERVARQFLTQNGIATVNSCR